jgi:hypothetical protein
LVILAVATAISLLYHLALATLPIILASWLKRKIRSVKTIFPDYSFVKPVGWMYIPICYGF